MAYSIGNFLVAIFDMSAYSVALAEKTGNEAASENNPLVVE